MSRLVELLGHCRVEADHHFTLLSHLLVAFFLLLSHPVLERLANNSRADVDYPLLRNLWKVLVVWQVVLNIWIIGDLFKDLLYREALVLRHMKVLDLVILNVSLLLVKDVLTKGNCHIVCKIRTVKKGFGLYLP